jgi:cystathionine beta-lyase
MYPGSRPEAVKQFTGSDGALRWPAMWTKALGPLWLAVEHRRADGDGGPSLRVHEGGAAGYERLRFDCFERSPHWHLDADGRDELRPLDPDRDPIGWTVERLRRDLSGLLKEAGLELATPLDADALEAAAREAERALWNPPPGLDDLRLDALRAKRGEKWRLYGDDVIAAWVADMDFPVCYAVDRSLRGMLDRRDLGYPLNPRPQDLPAVFAARMRERHGWDVDPHRVEVMTDVVQGLYTALHVYSEPGDGVVVQPPIYRPFLLAVRDMGRRLIENPLVRGERGYAIDFDALRGAVDGGTRVLLLCHPHNPTGRVFTREEARTLAGIAIERDLVVVSDEIHGDLAYGEAPYQPLALLAPEIADRTVTLTSATKAFNIAGLRCAVAHFGSDALRRRFLSLPRHVRGGLNGPGLLATEAAWRHGQPWLDAVVATLRRNREVVANTVRERLPGVGFHPPEATYLAWLDCRSLGLADPHAFFLEKARVGLSNGRSFGTGGEGFVRLNFATSLALLEEILDRMARALAA